MYIHTHTHTARPCTESTHRAIHNVKMVICVIVRVCVTASLRFDE